MKSAWFILALVLALQVWKLRVGVDELNHKITLLESKIMMLLNNEKMRDSDESTGEIK